MAIHIRNIFSVFIFIFFLYLYHVCNLCSSMPALSLLLLAGIHRLSSDILLVVEYVLGHLIVCGACTFDTSICNSFAVLDRNAYDNRCNNYNWRVH